MSDELHLVKRPRHSHGLAASTVPVPLDQGAQKTCVQHAVASAAAQGLLAKNGIYVHAEKLAEKFEDNVGEWQGLSIVDFCERWNVQSSSIWVKNVDNTERYQLRLEVSEPITDIDAAYEKLEHVRGVLMLVCAVTYGRIKSHAVTADFPSRVRPNMRAVNSWGSLNTVIDVTCANFQYAVLVEPVVEAWARGGGRERTTAYNFTTEYKELKKQEQEQQEGKDDDGEEEEEMARIEERKHHASSGDDLEALKERAEAHPALFLGVGNLGRNGKKCITGWVNVVVESDESRKGEFRATSGNCRLTSGTLLECVDAVINDRASAA